MGEFLTDTVTRLETNLDDTTPELMGAAMQRLLAAGAMDVWLTPILMKKQRPGVLLSVLCEPEKANALARLIFRETTAFGLRSEAVSRLKLERRFESVNTCHGPVTIKIGHVGAEIYQVAPEFESCRALAEATGSSVREVFAAATAAAHEWRQKQWLSTEGE